MDCPWTCRHVRQMHKINERAGPRPELIVLMNDSDSGKRRGDDWTALSVNHVISAVFVCNIKIWELCFRSNYSDRRACVCACVCVCAHSINRKRNDTSLGMLSSPEKQTFLPLLCPSLVLCLSMGPTWRGGKEKWQDKGTRGGRWQERGWEKGEDVSAWVCVEGKKNNIFCHLILRMCWFDRLWLILWSWQMNCCLIYKLNFAAK